MGPSLIFTGASISISKSYRVQLWMGWALQIIAMGAMSTLRADTPLAHAIGFPILVGFGSGMVYSTTYFPVLAPVPVQQNAYALAFFAFCRSLAAVSTYFPISCARSIFPR